VQQRSPDRHLAVVRDIPTAASADQFHHPTVVSHWEPISERRRGFGGRRTDDVRLARLVTDMKRPVIIGVLIIIIIIIDVIFVVGGRRQFQAGVEPSLVAAVGVVRGRRVVGRVDRRQLDADVGPHELRCVQFRQHRM